jgi:BirA family transcriptional regulator, biotin operon repressor / biotin---[acetyl-CoA-carboxylase] ligase
MLFAQQIEELRSPAASQIAIEIVAETRSTNTDLLNRTKTLAGPVLLFAEKQTQGRGRSGRTWLSEVGDSLTFSLAWKFGRKVHELSGLPLAVGVAVAQTLEAYDVRTALKWPNDILKDGRKLGGILIETEETHNGTWAVIGIGLNLALSDELETQIDQPAAEARWLAQTDRHALLASLMNRLAESMVEFDREGIKAFIGNWNQLHAHTGKKVTIHHGDKVLFEGVASGIDELGRLLLDTTMGRKVINAGDVSLRTTKG